MMAADRKPCVWYISKYLTPPAEGTVGARGYLLMKTLAAAGHPVLIITSDSNPYADTPRFRGRYLREERDGLTLVWIRTARYRVAKSFRRVLSWLHFEFGLARLQTADYPRPDCVIVSSLSLLTVLNGLLLKRRYGCRMVFEVRDIWPLTLVEEGGFSRYNPFVYALGLVEKAGYRHSDAIVGTMPNLGQRVAETLGGQKETHCIPMGVEDGMEAAPPGQIVERARAYVARHVPPGKFIVAYAGTMGITNALDTLFACAKALAGHPSIHFVMIGDGDLREHYESAHGHLPNLTFAPKVPKEMVQSVLQHCDLLYFAVHPSRVWDYGQSLNKIIDYMLSGRPIVASYSGFPTMINESGCGSFVPADDPSALQAEILRYESMPKGDRDQMGAAGRSWLIANRTYTKLARDYTDIMFGCAAAPASARDRP